MLFISNVFLLPFRIPGLRLPSPSLFPDLLAYSFAVALVTFAVDISLGKTIAERHDYKIDENQVHIVLKGRRGDICWKGQRRKGEGGGWVVRGQPNLESTLSWMHSARGF